ncbi:MAG: DUF2461 domain-containing protein [Deltaproteobacteria bacterium]|nr:DUF2461 domain-containing protein [Deltaproteobacteria bacterium]
MSGQGFDGFPRDCVAFLRELRRHNDREWFERNRDRYQASVLRPARSFVAALGLRLYEIAPAIHADATASIFRIHRDVRFAKDKSPFKTNLAIWLWEGGRPRLECSGFYFELEPPDLLLATGIYQFPRPLLPAYRASVVHALHGPELIRVIAKVRSRRRYQLGGQKFKQTPRGYDPEHPNARWLLHDGLYAMHRDQAPAELFRPDLVDYCFARYRDMLPLHTWLRGVVERA